MSEPPPRRPLPARLIGTGARGARHVAGLAGLDRAAETAVEEAIVQAAESPAVERALVRILEGPQFEEALASALGQPAVERALARALDSRQFDHLWNRLLASDEAQRLVERIAEAPEVRAAVTAQGAGLIEDLGRQLRGVARRLDDGIERLARRILGRPQRAAASTDAGLITRALALGLDALILNGIFIVISGVIALTASFILGDTGHISIAGVALGAVGWTIAWTIYLLFFWSLSGQTPGMRFLAIALEADGSRRIGLRRSARRLVGLALAILSLGLGFLGILFTARRRGLPDRMADTEVVYVEIEPRPAPWSGARPVPQGG
ncbi:MAG TPA: RDD family protein [Solirubrobacterales bacterium]